MSRRWVVHNEAVQELRNRYKAIILADSDNDPADSDLPRNADLSLIPNTTRAALAADRCNAVTVFPLTLINYGDMQDFFWSIQKRGPYDVVLQWLDLLKDFSLKESENSAENELSGPDVPDEPGDPDKPDDPEKPGKDEPVNPAENEHPGTDTPEQQAENKQPDTDAPEQPTENEYSESDNSKNAVGDIQSGTENPETMVRAGQTAKYAQNKYDFAQIRDVMMKEDRILYSPTDWRYDPASDSSFDIFVRTSSSALLNVFLDDILLPVSSDSCQVIDEENGIFLLRISGKIMQALPTGDHRIKLQLTGYGNAAKTIHVQDRSG